MFAIATVNGCVRKAHNFNLQFLQGVAHSSLVVKHVFTRESRAAGKSGN